MHKRRERPSSSIYLFAYNGRILIPYNSQKWKYSHKADHHNPYHYPSSQWRKPPLVPVGSYNIQFDAFHAIPFLPTTSHNIY